jgi:hypothetical protein
MKTITYFLARFFLLVYLFVSFNIVLCQSIVHVDERFELTSIAFRLTGESIHTPTTPANYVRDIDDYFSQYKDHELVEFIRNHIISSEHNYGFSIVSGLAADVEITPKGIVYTKKWNLAYDPDKNDPQYCLTHEELKEYLRLLNKFYKDTKFHSFYEQHHDFYHVAEMNMQEWVNQIDTAWFSEFFGKPFRMDNIWLVPANGDHNFGITRYNAEGEQFNNIALGCPSTDSLGNIIFDLPDFGVLLHEICHNYTLPILMSALSDFRPICDTLFQYDDVRSALTRWHYGAVSISIEGINRLCEFCYYQTHHTYEPEELKLRVKSQEYTGFIWFGEMLEFMNYFSSHRDLYPYFDSFLPQLKGFLQQVAANMDSYYIPKMRRPMVVSTFPANGTAVDTTLTEVVIVFSESMFTGLYWTNYPQDSAGVQPLPVDFDNLCWKDERTYVVPLSEPLKPHTAYGFSVAPNLTNIYRYRAAPYDLIFETK